MNNSLPRHLDSDRDEILAFRYYMRLFHHLLCGIQKTHGTAARRRAVKAVAAFLHHARLENAPSEALRDSIAMLLYNFSDMLYEEAC